MASAALVSPCRIPGCHHDVPLPLTAELLCPEHFVELAFRAAQRALESCRHGEPVHPHAIEWLFSDAMFHAQALTQEAEAIDPRSRERLLELLLCLANLHEYVRHHTVRLVTAG